MSDTPFYLTGMGRKFYEGTMPDLVEQLKRLNDNLEKAGTPTAFAVDTIAREAEWRRSFQHVAHVCAVGNGGFCVDCGKDLK